MKGQTGVYSLTIKRERKRDKIGYKGKKQINKQANRKLKQNLETQFGEVGNLKLIKIIYTTIGKGWFFHLYSKGFELTSTSAEMHQLANLQGFN